MSVCNNANLPSLIKIGVGRRVLLTIVTFLIDQWMGQCVKYCTWMWRETNHFLIEFLWSLMTLVQVILGKIIGFGEN